VGTDFVEESAASIFSVRDEVAGSSEMSVNIYQATKRHIEDGSIFIATVMRTLTLKSLN
jgi:hypothetical protein